jgi:hypothetical protein
MLARPRSFSALFLAFAVFSLSSSTVIRTTTAATRDWFTPQVSQSGEGTYYTQPANPQSGHCSIGPNPPSGDASRLTHVALNSGKYGNSEPCGMCVEVTGNGVTAGNDPISGTFR